TPSHRERHKSLGHALSSNDHGAPTGVAPFRTLPRREGPKPAHRHWRTVPRSMPVQPAFVARARRHGKEAMCPERLSPGAAPSLFAKLFENILAFERQVLSFSEQLIMEYSKARQRRQAL